ncbi:hypothetical protein HK097_005232 [Rhizophlyctis rosea]|uniref:Glutaredoxin domain-containing protein n=1 Tax=Rhizophlyctis rosea TaxID=64517 RepID=A0AAD5SDG2_9FUNG|nr:hypothetical protein HK097_005232 [Rhizophlyctis rosea]
MPRLRSLLYPTAFVATLFLLYRSFSSPSATSEHVEQTLSSKTCINVEGFGSCPYFRRARAIAERMSTLEKPDIEATVKEWYQWEWDERKEALQKTITGASNHRTSPFVWLGCNGKVDEFLGGSTDLDGWIQARAKPKEQL